MQNFANIVALLYMNRIKMTGRKHLQIEVIESGAP